MLLFKILLFRINLELYTCGMLTLAHNALWTVDYVTAYLLFAGVLMPLFSLLEP